MVERILNTIGKIVFATAIFGSIAIEILSCIFIAFEMNEASIKLSFFGLRFGNVALISIVTVAVVAFIFLCIKDIKFNKKN